jgi:hypothetical protein
MKITIEIDTEHLGQDSMTLERDELVWTLRKLADEFAHNRVANVATIFGPYHDDVGTVKIS